MESRAKIPLSLNPEDYLGQEKGCFAAIGAESSRKPPPSPARGAAKAAQEVDGDELLAKEMNELSLSEREKVYEDIHGMPMVIEEDEDFITRALESMDDEISRIHKKSAFERATFLSPRYVNDRKFRLLFLRAEHFDAKKAAIRVVKHFEGKLELFGHGKLVKDIQLEDLLLEDMNFLRQGVLQILSETDNAGRPIILYGQKLRGAGVTWSCKLKAFWYITMTRLRQDEESQKKGFVAVVDNVGDVNANDTHELFAMTKSALYFAGLPVRFGCFHYCVSDDRVHAFVSLAKVVIGSHNRLRFRVHFGSTMEVLYEMATFGLPRKIIPIDDEGNHDKMTFLQHLETQAALEAEQKNRAKTDPGVIDYPSELDVLLGRGRPYHIYSGNVRLANMINQRRGLYETVEKGEKWTISAEIVKSVLASGGRFLKRASDSESWVEVDEDKAREKVSQSFRTRPKRNSYAQL